MFHRSDEVIDKIEKFIKVKIIDSSLLILILKVCCWKKI